MQIQDSKTIDLYYKALLEKDEKYIGIYYVGVKTTSIFCISTLLIIFRCRSLIRGLFVRGKGN